MRIRNEWSANSVVPDRNRFGITPGLLFSSGRLRQYWSLLQATRLPDRPKPTGFLKRAIPRVGISLPALCRRIGLSQPPSNLAVSGRERLRTGPCAWQAELLKMLRGLTRLPSHPSPRSATTSPFIPTFSSATSMANALNLNPEGSMAVGSRKMWPAPSKEFPAASAGNRTETDECHPQVLSANFFLQLTNE